MKFTCSTTSLNKAIQTVQRAISSKPTAPIFSGIHIIAAENILYVQAMDLNMAISCTVELFPARWKAIRKPMVKSSYRPNILPN